MSVGLTHHVSAAESKGTAEASVIDLEGKLNDVGREIYQQSYAGSMYNELYRYDERPTSVVSSHGQISIDPDSVESDLTYSAADPLYFGDNTFTNNTDNQQTYNTPVYSHEVQQTTTVTNTKGFRMGDSGILMKLPLMMKEGMKISVPDNTSSTKSESTAIKDTLTSPAQPVVVPPHSKYQVKTYLVRNEFSGPVTYRATGQLKNTDIHTKAMWVDATGTPHTKSVTIPDETVNYWHDLSDDRKNNISDFSINEDNNTFDFNGETFVEGVYGSTFAVETYDVTNSDSADKLVDRQFVTIP